MDGLSGLDKVAADRQVQKSLGARWRRFTKASVTFIKSIPRLLRSNAMIALAVGSVFGIFAWEIWNSTLGFNRLFPSRAGFTWIAAGGSTLAYIWFHRRAMEFFRDWASGLERVVFGALNLLLALLALGVSMFGTFSNIVADALDNGYQSIDAEAQRNVIRDVIAKLDREYYNMYVPTNGDSLKEDLAARLSEAEGWGMKNLDNIMLQGETKETTTAECVRDVKPRQRFLCNEASEIRSKLKEIDEAQAAKDAKKIEIDAKQKELDNIKDTEKARHFQAMSQMTGGKVSWDEFATWGLFALTFAMCLFGGVLADYVLEARENAVKKQKGVTA